MKQKVLITGALKLPMPDKKQMIQIVGKVQAGIKAAKLEWHPHLLDDNVVVQGVTDDVVPRIKMATEFARVQRSISTRKYNLVRQSRHTMPDDQFNIVLTVRRILDEQLKHALAGIAILTWESPGAAHIIGRMEQIGLPVLCLSNRDNFGTVVSGSFSLQTVTRIYRNISEIPELVSSFLLDQNKSQVMIVKSYSLPAVLAGLVSQMPNASEFVAEAVREKLEGV